MKIKVNGQEGIIPNELIKSATQDMGELFPTDLRRCNDNKLCPSCVLKGRTKPCNQPYWNKYVRGEPEPIEIVLITGETFYVEEIISREDE